MNENKQKGILNEIEEPKSRYKRKLFNAAFLVLVVTITFLLLFREDRLDDVLISMMSAEFRFIILAIAMIVLYVLFEALSYLNLFRTQKRKIKKRNAIKYAVINFYFSSISPAALAGQATTSYYMQKDQIPTYPRTITLLMHNILFRLSLTIIGFTAVMVMPKIFQSNPVLTTFLIIGLILNAILMIGFIFGLFSKRIVRKLIAIMVSILIILRIFDHRKEAYMRYYERKIIEYNQAAKYMMHHLWSVLGSFLLSMAQRVSIFSVGYFVFLSFGGKGHWVEFILIHATISIAVESLPLPGGIGLSEHFMQSLYGLIYLGAMKEYLTAGLLVTRSIVLYGSVVLTGLIYLGISIFRARKRRIINDRYL